MNKYLVAGGLGLLSGLVVCLLAVVGRSYGLAIVSLPFYGLVFGAALVTYFLIEGIRILPKLGVIFALSGLSFWAAAFTSFFFNSNDAVFDTFGFLGPGFAGGLVLSLGLLVLFKKARLPVVVSSSVLGGLLAYTGGLLSSLLSAYTGGLLSSLISIGFLYIIWQTGMMLAIAALYERFKD